MHRQTSLAVAALASVFAVTLTAFAAAGGPPYVEDFESFREGSAVGQDGWDGDKPERLVIVDADVPGFGARSIRYEGGTFDGGSNGLLLSPAFNNQYGTLFMDVVVHDQTPFDIGGWVIGVAETGVGPAARVRFGVGGDVQVAQTTGTCLTGYFASEGTWEDGVRFRLGISILDDFQTQALDLEVSIDGETVFTGGQLGCLPADRIGELFLWSGHPFGIDLTGSDITIDNIEFRPQLAADIDGDGSVGVTDLIAVLAAWGPCPAGGPCDADLDFDGQVGTDDLLAVLAGWTG